MVPPPACALTRDPPLSCARGDKRAVTLSSEEAAVCYRDDRMRWLCAGVPCAPSIHCRRHRRHQRCRRRTPWHACLSSSCPTASWRRRTCTTSCCSPLPTCSPLERDRPCSAVLTSTRAIHTSGNAPRFATYCASKETHPQSQFTVQAWTTKNQSNGSNARE